jgi:hypothetical protein
VSKPSSPAISTLVNNLGFDGAFERGFDTAAHGITANMPPDPNVTGGTPGGPYHFAYYNSKALHCRATGHTAANCSMVVQFESALLPIRGNPVMEATCSQNPGSCDPNKPYYNNVGASRNEAVRLTEVSATCFAVRLIPTTGWRTDDPVTLQAPPQGINPPSEFEFSRNRTTGSTCASSARSNTTSTASSTGSAAPSETQTASGAAPRAIAGSSGSSDTCATLPMASTTPPSVLWVTRSDPSVSCAVALKVMRDLGRGMGIRHEGSDNADSWTNVDGWHCTSGTGTACERSGKTINQAVVPASSVPKSDMSAGTRTSTTS